MQSPSLIVALTPARRMLIAGLLLVGVAWLAGPPGRMLVALLLLLFGPGYLFGRLLLPDLAAPFLVRLALALGFSLSLLPLAYLWLTVAGLALSPTAVALLAATIAIAVVPLLWREGCGAGRDQPRPGPPWAGIALLLVCVLTLWARFAEIENLALPAWVDSVHHALLVRIVAEQGRAPLSLEPYLPVRDLPYHWGYHVLLGAVMQLSALPVDRLLLWSGQLLNALHAPMAAALALALWRRPMAALVAALVVGLVSYMPAYYVSWGRYTQLTGLLMAPALVIAWQQALVGASPRWWVAAACLLAGLSLVHFRVLLFLLALLGALSLVWAVEQPPRLSLLRLRAALLCAMAAMACTAPWLFLIARQTLLPAIERPQNLIIEGNYNALRPELLWVGLNPTLIPLALLAALWVFRRRSRVALTMLIWVAGLTTMASPQILTYLVPAAGALLLLTGLETLFQRPALWAGKTGWRALLAIGRVCALIAGGLALLLINPWRVRIPAIYLITFDAVLISLFLPIAILIAGGAAMLYERMSAMAGRRRLLTDAGAIVLVSVAALWGGYALRDVLNQNTVLATEADRAALNWVAEHTAPEARFLINAAPWIGGTDRGVDGGWWLLPLTGRWTSTPPALFIYGPPAYVAEVQARNRIVIDYKPGQEQTILDLIVRERITHLYFGSRPGPLKVEPFAQLPGFTTVYSRDGVTILAVGE